MNHPTSATKTQFSWRPAQREDLPQMQQLFIAAQETDEAEIVPSLEQMERLFALLEAEPNSHTLLAISPEQTVAALAFLFPSPNDEEQFIQIDGHVHPNYRQQGLGTHIMEWGESTAKQFLQHVDHSKPQRLVTSSMMHHSDRIDLFEQQGFQAMRYNYTMSRSLDEPLPLKELPAGLTAVSYTPDYDIPMMHAFNTAFAEHWGLYAMTPELWQRRFIRTPYFRPDLTYLALDKAGEIAGFCLSEIHQEQNNQKGKKEAWMEAIGVLPQWRKQGVASALMMLTMRQCRAVGMETVGLDVDTQNPTGALSLYQDLGFKTERCKIIFTKTLH